MDAMILGLVALLTLAVGLAVGGRRGRVAAAPGRADPDAPAAERDREGAGGVETGLSDLGQRWLRAALDAHGDAVLVVDAAGDVVLCNEAGRRYERGRYSDALVEDILREVVASALAGDSADREVALFGPPERVLVVHGEPVRDAQGGVAGAVAIVRDVTEARRVDRIRRDFVAAVSHELKTPIGALSLLAETMQEAEEPDVVLQLAVRIGEEAQRLSRIVDDLLDLSIVESQERPRREPTPVHLLVEEAHDLVRAAAAAAGVPIQIAVPLPEVAVPCDRRQVVSAVRNLLENAVKYSEPGAPVEVEACRDGETVVITVRDHGIGIPRRDLERIFERFYRVDRARSRSTGGTGLGLSIVRHVAAAHGGDVRVESVEGEGSTFELRLPCATPGAHLSAVS